MTGDSPKNQEGAEGLGISGKDLAMGRVRYTGVGIVLLGSRKGSSVVWFRVVRHVRGNGKYGGCNKRRIPPEY